MLELDFDDALWRDALGAIRGGGIDALGASRPELAGLLDELAAEARSESLVVGARLGTPGKNGRLFSFLTAAFLARSGVRTLYLDLSADLRWLEHLVGEDLKEGLIDHLRYGVPLERCVRPTALPDLAVLSGGAYFLAGSPLEDAPALRAALEGLREGRDAVVVVFPQPAEAADAAGLATRCDALLTIREGDAGVPLAGNERALFRLTGDPHAARELVRLVDAFVGPLPALLADSSGAPASSPTRVASGAPAEPPPPIGRPDLPARRALDEVDFLRAFEEDRPPPRREPRARPAAAMAGVEDEAEVEAPPEPGERRGSGLLLAGGLAAAVGMILVLAFATDLLDPLLAGDGGPPAAEVVDEEGGTMVSLDGGGLAPGTDPAAAAGDSAGAADSAAALAPLAVDTGDPAPWSVHVGSYQTPEAGQRLVDRIAELGELAFLAPVNLPGKGRWHRVYVGAFADSTGARAALGRLLDEGLVEEGTVRVTPWAFRVGAYDSRAEAEDRRAALAGRGVPAYLVGDGPIRVYAGAYRDADEASLMSQMIGGTAEAVLDLRRN